MIEHFHKPRTIREAIGLKKKLGGSSAFVAGGTCINAKACPRRPKHAVSLKGLGLDKIELKAGRLVIGAMCTLQDIIEGAGSLAPLKTAAAQVSSRNIRNMATIGGHIVRNDTHSDVIPMLIALGSKVNEVAAGRKKTWSIEVYVTQTRDALITHVIVPKMPPNRVAVCRNVRESSNSTSIVTVAVSLAVQKDRVSKPAIALGGASSHVVRLTAVEERLDSRPLPSVDDIMKMVSDEVEASSDILGSESFKRYEAGAIVALALHDAFRQGGGRR